MSERVAAAIDAAKSANFRFHQASMRAISAWSYSTRANICDFLRRQTRLTQLCGGCLLRSCYYNRMPYMTDQGPLGRPPRGASVPGGAPRGAGPQLIRARAEPPGGSPVRRAW